MQYAKYVFNMHIFIFRKYAAIYRTIVPALVFKAV